MDLDFAAYTRRNLSDTFTLYWKILKEQQEIEVVMIVNGTSYVGLGWRPRHLTASCRNFPHLEDPGSKDGNNKATTSGSKPELGGNPEPTGKPEPSSEPESSSQPEPTSEPEPSSEPEPGTKPEPTNKPESKPKHNKVSSRETKDYNSPEDKDVTVETSVSYRVSSSQGECFYNS